MTTLRVLSDAEMARIALGLSNALRDRGTNQVLDDFADTLHSLQVARADIRGLLNAFGGGRLWSWLNLNDPQRASLQRLAETYALFDAP